MPRAVVTREEAANAVVAQIQELERTLVGLAAEGEQITQSQNQLDQTAREIEDQSRELASQEAVIQLRKKEIQARAKLVGQRRAEILKRTKELEDGKLRITAEIEALHNRSKELEREQVADERRQIEDRAFLAEQARLEALRLAEAERQRSEEQGRRKSRRVKLAVDVSMTTEHNFFMGLTENLSEGGLFVATYEILPIGTQIEVTLNLPGCPPIQTRAEVRWLREHNEFTADVAPGYGVRFLDLAAESQQVIRTFLAQRDPILFEECA